MSFLDTLSSAFKGGGGPRVPLNKAVPTGYVSPWAATFDGGTGRPAYNYTAALQHGFIENPVAQRAVRIVAEGVGSAPLSDTDPDLSALLQAPSAGQSLRQIGHPFDAPSDYALRTLSTGPLLESLRDCPARRLRRAADDRTGDIVLCAVGPAQSHLVIIDRNQAPDARAQTTFIHAHAGLRRVVRTPGRPPWPVVARWRMD